MDVTHNFKNDQVFMDYNLGLDGKYQLTEKAISHIIVGEISDRQERDESGNTILTKIIAGGLHTFEAWNNFLKLRPDVTHGLLVDSMNHEKWYYARQLQNEVILLKIPRDCFQSKAANITKFPETYYKSGYLWKTLFPIKYSKEQIISLIDEALRNIDIEESSESLIIGYANKNDFFKSIKIRIQVRENRILSAFPTWEQPMTGNNGKPFSHIDAINTIISSSCVFGNHDEVLYLSNTIGKWNQNSIYEFYNKCPEIIKSRKPPKKDKSRKDQLNRRIKELKEFGEAQSEFEIETLAKLCMSDEYIRHTLDFVRFLYNESYKEIKERLNVKNSASVFQNFHDLLIIINAWDKRNNGSLTITIIEKLLKIRFIRTGGIDQWEMKRLSNLICNIVISYNNPEITLNFLKLVSTSPMRIAFYSEFNLNPYFLPSPMLIGLTGNEENPLTDKHFYDFVSQNLGINYTANFEDNFNKELARKIQLKEHRNGLKVVEDLISHAVGSDFNYFSIALIDLCKTLEVNSVSIEVVETIVYDYYRCIAASIQRILAKHKNLLKRDLDFGDKDFTKYTKAKHEYKFLWVLNKIMIEDISKLFKEAGFEEFAKKLEDKYLSLYHEIMKIPMPKAIPKYLKSDETI